MGQYDNIQLQIFRQQFFEGIDDIKAVILKKKRKFVKDEVILACHDADIAIFFQILLTVKINNFTNLLNFSLNVGHRNRDEVNRDEIVGMTETREPDQQTQLTVYFV